MKLERGKEYKHRSGFVGIYSHSDEHDYNHFFKAVKNPKNWNLDSLGMVDLLTVNDLGKVWAIQGPKATSAQILVSLAVKFQRYGKVLFIDANDQFNPDFIRKKYHKTKLNLKNIKIARPFTAIQLISIINKLHTSIPETNAKAVVISGFDKLFFTAEEKNRPFIHVT